MADFSSLWCHWSSRISKNGHKIADEEAPNCDNYKVDRDPTSDPKVPWCIFVTEEAAEIQWMIH